MFSELKRVKASLMVIIMLMTNLLAGLPVEKVSAESEGGGWIDTQLFNGGFENGEESWSVFSYGGGSISIVTDTYYTGSKSAKVVGDINSGRDYYKETLLEPNTKYRLSVWMKAEDLTTTPFLAFGDSISSDPNAVFLYTEVGTHDWTKAELEFDTGELYSDKTQSFKKLLWCGLWNTKGTAWFDDIKLEKYIPPTIDAPANLSAEAGQRSVTLSWDESLEAADYDVYYKMSANSDYILSGSTETTSYEVTGLLTDTNYDFKVIAKNGEDNVSQPSELKNIKTKFDPNQPKQPSDFQASSEGITYYTIKLAWTNSEDETITGYNLFYKKSSDESYQSLGATESLTYTATGLIPGTSYDFKIVSKNAQGVESNPVMMTGIMTRSAGAWVDTNLYNGGFELGMNGWTPFSANGASAPVIDTTVAYTGTSSAKLVNSGAPDGPYTYILKWASDPADTAFALEPNTRYRISAWVKASNLDAGNSGGANLSIDWGKVGIDAPTGTYEWTYIEKEFNTADVDGWKDKTSKFQVEFWPGLNGSGTVWFDDVKLEKFDTTIVPPMEPTELTAAEKGPDFVKLSWTAADDENTNPIAGYNVYYKKSTDSTYIFGGYTTETEYTISGLTPTISYDFKVVSKDEKGIVADIAAELKDVFTPYDENKLTAPTELEVLEATLDLIVVTWNAPNDDRITGYEVSYKKSAEADFTSLGQTSETIYTINSLEEDTEYDLKVVSVDSQGNKSDTVVITNIKTQDDFIGYISIIENGGFENGFTSWGRIFANGGQEAVIDSAIKRTDNNSAKLVSTGSGAPYTFLSKFGTLTLDPEGQYKFTAWVKGASVAGSGVSISVMGEKTISQGITTKGDFDWTQISLEFNGSDVSPSETGEFTASIKISLDGTGTVWVDDVEVNLWSAPKPSAPRDLKALEVNAESVKLGWTKPADTSVNGYYVYYKRSDASDYTFAGETADTEYTVSGLRELLDFDFKVVSKTADDRKSTPTILTNIKTPYGVREWLVQETENGDFESDLAGWKVEKYNGSDSAAIDTAEYNDGSKSVKLTVTGNADNAYTTVTKSVKLLPNTKYKLAAYVKGTGIDYNTANGINIGVKGNKEAYAKLDKKGNIDKWEQISLEFNTRDIMPDATQAFDASIWASLNGTGTAWIDGIKLEKWSTPALSSPTEPKATQVFPDSCTLEWTASDDSAVTGYYIYYRENASEAYFKPISTTKTSYEIIGLKAETDYVFKIMSRDENDVTSAPVIVNVTTPEAGYIPDEVSDLVTLINPPKRFANHVPNFSWTEEMSLTGGLLGKSVAIKDGDNYVALFKLHDTLDVITFDPTKAVDRIELPSRYDWASLLGTRIQTVFWNMYSYPFHSNVSYEFTGGGETLTLTVTENFANGGIGKHIITLECDDVLGYVFNTRIELSLPEADLQTDHRGLKDIEYVNVQPRGVSDPWPDKTRYDFMAFSTINKNPDGYWGFYNNSPASDRTNDPVESGGNEKILMKDKGIVVFVDEKGLTEEGHEDGWSFATSRIDLGSQAGKHYNLTCNAWMDQHHIFQLPDKDEDGNYTSKVKMRFVNLPPEITQYIVDNTEIDKFGDWAQIQLQLGTTDDMEDQPHKLGENVRGPWSWNFGTSTKYAYSGEKSLLIKGGEVNPDPIKPQFSPLQVKLQPYTRYLLSVMVYLEGEGTEAYVTAHGYHGSPFDTYRSPKRESEHVKTIGEWKEIKLYVDSTEGAYVDLKLIATGTGNAYFDDLHFVELEPISLDAEDYSSMSGIESNETEIICNEGDWVCFEDVDFGMGSIYFSTRLSATSAVSGKDIEVRLDSPDGAALGKITTNGTGAWDVNQEQGIELKGITGKHDVYIAFTGGANAGKGGTRVANVDSFKFAIQEPPTVSNNAKLSNIKIDGVAIQGFRSDLETYSVELPVGTTSVPKITATAVDELADVQITQPTSANGFGTITVTAEDGTVKIYTVNFRTKLSPISLAAPVVWKNQNDTVIKNIGNATTVKASFKLTNSATNKDDATCVVAYYGDNDRLITANRYIIPVNGSASKEFTLSIKLAGLGDVKKIKLMFLDNLSNLLPIEKVTELLK